MKLTDEPTCTRCGGHPREVCDQCGEHSCWEGEFMCHESKWAGTVVAPPRDIPADHDFAVIRSVGAMRMHNGRAWRWADGRWHLVDRPERAS